MKGIPRKFTSLIDEYVVLKLLLEDYRPTSRTLPEGYEIRGSEIRPDIREQEKALLAANFEHWSGPYEGKLKGWRNDSPLYVLYGDKLVAGLYLCSENEFEEGERWGQIHYAYMEYVHRGKGIYSVLFASAVEKARRWNLEGLILNSDRHLLPEVYLKWGAQPWKRLTKVQSYRRLSLARRLARYIFSR
jgi:GNAT superfamily N-acetyltransferase